MGIDECARLQTVRATRYRPDGDETSRSDRKKVLRRRPGWPLDRFSTVERAWDGATVVILGGGPSLTGADCAAVERARTASQGRLNGAEGTQALHAEAAQAQVRVIAVNNAYLLAPWADICYFADSCWWTWHRLRPEFVAFAGEKCSIQNSGGSIEDADVHILRNQHYPVNGTGLSLNPECLITGSNSGFQSVNVSVLAGAKLILLLGFDAREPVGREPSHFHVGHPVATPHGAYPAYRKSFKDAAGAIKAAGVRVINCNPNSAIDAFPKVPLAQALECGA